MKVGKIDFSIKNTSFYIFGVLTIGFGINLMLLSELGAGAWDTPSANGQAFFNLVVGWEWVSFGMLSVLINSIILLMIILYRKDLKYLIILIPIFIMGSVVDLWEYILFRNLIVDSMLIRVLFYTIGGLLLPLGLALVVKSKFPAFVFEELTFMFQELTKLSFQMVRIGIELIGMTLGTVFAVITFIYADNPDVVMFGQVGIGTIVLSVLIGPLIQFYMFLLNVPEKKYTFKEKLATIKQKTVSEVKNFIKLVYRERYRLTKYILGMLFIAIGVSFMLKSNIGNSSWDTLHYSLEHLLHISFGTATIIVALTFTILVIWLNKSFKYLLMAIPIFVVGPLIDMTNLIISSEVIPELIPLKILYFIIGISLLPLGGACLLISTYPAGVFDEFNLAIVRKLKLKSLVPTRVIMELTAVLAAAILGYFAGFEYQDLTYGKIGLGTLIFATTVGIYLKTYLKLFERIGLNENQQIN